MRPCVRPATPAVRALDSCGLLPFAEIGREPVRTVPTLFPWEGPPCTRTFVIPIHLPPLRERREDIALLAPHFVAKISAELGKPTKGVSPEALAILENYRWPGNIRELENVIERALVLGGGDTLEADALPPDLHQPRDLHEVTVEIPADGIDLEAMLDQIEHRYLQMALARTGGVQTRAAELLRVSFRQFRYKLQKHGQRNTSSA